LPIHKENVLYMSNPNHQLIGALLISLQFDRDLLE